MKKEVKLSLEESKLIREIMGIKDLSVNGKCSKCGECCSNYLPMNKKDIQRLRKYIEKNNIQPVTHNPVPSIFKVDGMCPFLSNKSTNRCLVYEARPQVCRDFNCHNIIIEECDDSYDIVDVREEFYGKLG